MNELALFAGHGGGILGGRLLGWRTVCAVEYDDYARRVLMARQDDGCLDPFPIWDDVRTFDGKPWAGLVDVVSGALDLDERQIRAIAEHSDGLILSGPGCPGYRLFDDLIKQALGNSLTASIPALVATRRSEINESKADKLRVRLSKARLKDSSNDGQTTFL